MPKLTFLPHDEICPQGATFTAEAGISILDAALENGIDIEHSCEKACACTTCHVVVQEGFASLAEASEEEEDTLDSAWAITPESRLACQAIVCEEDLVIELPKYTVNIVSEHH